MSDLSSSSMTERQQEEDPEERREPLLIPIHSTGEIPEWAMLELNGELLMPKDFLAQQGKENPVEDDTNPLVPSDSFELGSVRFVNNVSGVCFNVSLYTQRVSLPFVYSPTCNFLLSGTRDDMRNARAQGKRRGTQAALLCLAETTNRR
jgi:hypothetical protein